MRKMLPAVLVMAGALAAASAVEAQRAPGNLTPPGGGIQNTKHNLTSGTNDIRLTNPADANGEICVFCHTPHGADTTVAAPLWNRAKTTAVFQVYDSPTFDAGTNGKAPAPSGTSLACLSCHDGTIAFDALRNLPGSGGFEDPPTSVGWLFNNGNNKMPAGRITNLGDGQANPDLRNDHPISMQYSLARSPGGTTANENDPSVDDLGGFYKLQTNGPGGRNYVNRTKAVWDADALPLSTETIGGAKDFVQCTSCHDPHRADNPTFLRKSNAGSALCLTCHKKDG